MNTNSKTQYALDRLKESIDKIIQYLPNDIDNKFMDDFNHFLNEIEYCQNQLNYQLTELSSTKEKLIKSEEKFKSIFNNSADAIFIHEPEGKFIEVNHIACERLNYSKEELLNMSPEAIDISEESEKVNERTSKVKEHGFLIFETKHKTKQGKIIPVEVNSSFIDYDGNLVILSIVRDIADRKKTEKALYDSEEKYRLMVEEHQMLFGQWI